jgi:DNA invertase Pin-like site-specific DNA recombinase
MLERQKDGIANAKLDKKYKGHKPLSAEKEQIVLRMAAEGKTRLSIAKELKMGEASVYRILARRKDPEEEAAFDRKRSGWKYDKAA